MKNRGSRVVLHSVLALAFAGATVLATGCSMFSSQKPSEEVKPVPVTPPPTTMAKPVEPKLPPPPPPVETKTYVVKKGDTLGSIASRHGVRVSELMEVNSISNPNKIRVGQEIKLPGYAKDTGKKVTSSSGNKKSGTAKKTEVAAGHAAAAAATDKTYVVKNGDTLVSIAARYGTTVSALRDANKLSADTATVPVGNKLTIPASKKPAKTDTPTGAGAAAAPGAMPMPLAPIDAPAAAE